MKALVKLFAIALLAAALPLGSASANIIKFHADLSSANEPILPVPSSGFGAADVTLDDVAGTLSITMFWVGLTANPAAGHIHCCGNPGVAVAVRVPFTGFPTTPSGTYSNTFVLPATLPGSPTLLLADFIAGLNAGLAYVNIHTANNPGGEIRGQLIRVPEPASLAIFGLGLAGLGWVSRKRLLRR